MIPKYKNIHFQQIDSTQTYSYNNLSVVSQSDQAIIYSTDHQTNGIGRNGKWHDINASSLLCTINIKIPNHQIQKIPFFSMMTTVSIQQILEQYNLKTSYKFINDIMCGPEHALKKLCGILCQPSCYNNQNIMHIGIGLNINMPHNACNNIDQPTTSMMIELKQRFHIEEIKHKIILRILDNIEILYDKGLQDFARYANNSLAYKGKEIELCNRTTNEIITSGILSYLDSQTGYLYLSNQNKPFANYSIRLKNY